MSEKWKAFLESLVPEQRRALLTASAATAKAHQEMLGGVPEGGWDMDDSNLDHRLIPPGGEITYAEIIAWRSEQVRADSAEIALNGLLTGLKIGVMFGGLGV